MTVVKFPDARNFLDTETRQNFWDAIVEDTQFNVSHFRDYRPSADVAESADAYEVYLAVPGIPKADLKVELEGNRLTIRGERTPVEGANTKEWRRREIKIGQFARSFYFPESLDAKGVTATYANGILTVKLKKEKDPETTQRIEIK